MLTMDELKNYFAADRFAILTTGIEIISASPEKAVCRMPIKDIHLNAGNVVQGGAVFTLADFAFAVAANSEGIITVSMSSNISFLKPATGEYLTATATRIAKTRHSCLYEIYVGNDAGNTVAHCTMNGFIKNMPLIP